MQVHERYLWQAIFRGKEMWQGCFKYATYKLLQSILNAGKVCSPLIQTVSDTKAFVQIPAIMEIPLHYVSLAFQELQLSFLQQCAWLNDFDDSAKTLECDIGSCVQCGSYSPPYTIGRQLATQFTVSEVRVHKACSKNKSLQSIIFVALGPGLWGTRQALLE